MIERISTHVLNTTLGMPAFGVPAMLERWENGSRWVEVGTGSTDSDGRIGQLNGSPLAPGDFRLTLDTADYFRTAHGQVFYPSITLTIRLDGARPHYHLPVLAGTYSYVTYLGS